MSKEQTVAEILMGAVPLTIYGDLGTYVFFTCPHCHCDQSRLASEITGFERCICADCQQTVRVFVPEPNRGSGEQNE